MIGYYVLLGIFLFYYFAMGWFCLTWCILAAVLNPSRFLPYTAAALALIGVFTAKAAFYKLKYTNTLKTF
jgi:hypothetical protein